MSNNKYIALPGGKECKLVNPINLFTDIPICFDPDQERIEMAKQQQKYDDFESNNPVLAITEVMPEGVEFEGSEVWQYKYKDGTVWLTDTEYQQKGLSFDLLEYNLKMHDNDIETRLAIKPLKAIEPVKKDAGSYLMLANVAGKEQDGINPALLSLWSNIEIWYGGIGKYESGRNFLLRMQDLYNVQLKGEDTGNLVNSFTSLKKLYPDAPLLDVVENKETVEFECDVFSEMHCALTLLLKAYQSDGKDDFHNLDPEQIAIKALEKADHYLSRQSIEGIVGLLEKRIKNLKAKKSYHSEHESYPQHKPNQIQFAIEELSDIIKEYNNGK